MSVNHARCAFGVVLVVCAAVFANNAIKSVPKTNTNQQQVDEEDTWVPYLESGLRDDFDWQLLKALNKPNSGNTIFSPISVKILLALLFEGASGLTEQEIQNALQFNGNKSIVRQDFSKVIGALTDNTIEGCDEQQRLTRKHETYTLNLASRIYIDLKHPIMQAYQTKACQKYRTVIEHANFTNAEKTSVIINQYVNHATLGKIPHLVSPSSVEHAELLLVNAIYFRGYWSHQFPMSQSHKGGFYLSPNNVAQVDFMATTDYYYYLESKELSAKLIRIPYKGKKFAMYVILPYAKTGLPALIQRLNVLSLKQLVNIMDKQTVDLILPKFKFEYQTGLREPLTSMGMVSMFQNTASLPGITRGTEANLKVTDAIQKAGIEVNEEGSTAFAATDIHLGNKFGDAQSSFNATHPFLFYIEDTESQTILFIGKVTNPLESVTVPLPLPSRFGDIAAVVPQAPRGCK